MAEEDDLYYLQPGFDLNSLTVPRLRNILVMHDIAFPGSAKKAQLVDIVEGELLPKAKRLLRERDRVRRTSKGITDVPSSQEGTEMGDEDLMPPPPVPKTPRSRKSKTNLAGETPSTSRRSKTPTTRKSSSKARQSDTETDGEKVTVSSRKTRKSTPGPTPVASAVRVIEPARARREDGASPFSDDNPFQQGSSPSPNSRRISSTSRSRKSTGRQSTSRRGETSSPVIKHEDEGKATYEFPTSEFVPITEEFTPEATRELRADQTDSQVVSRRSQALVRRKKKPASTAAKATPAVILTTVVAALAGWYRQEKINVGYCGVGQPSWSLASNPNIPALVHETLQPQCEPCPPHAVCFPDMQVKCESDFVLQQHPFGVGGILPVPPTCEPDSAKEKRVKVVADKAVEELRERRAEWECGEDVAPETSSTPAILEIPEETLKLEVAKMRRKDMSPDQFENLWRGALGDIMGRDEVEVTRDGTGRTLLSSTSLAKLPFSCAVRRWTIRTLAAYRITLALLVFAATSTLYGRHRLITYKEATAQIPDLVNTALDRLVTQAALKEDDRGDGFISVDQLRDDVLRQVFSARERERVWQNVRKIVEGNANVRAAKRESDRTGDVSRVWEWIGPVNMAPGLEGRKSGLLKNNPEAGLRQENEVREWDEGRPIY